MPSVTTSFLSFTLVGAESKVLAGPKPSSASSTWGRCLVKLWDGGFQKSWNLDLKFVCLILVSLSFRWFCYFVWLQVELWLLGFEYLWWVRFLWLTSSSLVQFDSSNQLGEFTITPLDCPSAVLIFPHPQYSEPQETSSHTNVTKLGTDQPQWKLLHK